MNGAPLRIGRWLPALLLPAVLAVSRASADPPSNLVTPFDSSWAATTHDALPHTIYLYTWPHSVAPGDTLSIYVSSVSPTVEIRFVQVGSADAYVFDQTGAHHPHVPAGLQLVPAGGGTNEGLWSSGCGWQPTLRIVIPNDWASAPYYVETWPENGESSVNRQYATFVVRNPNPIPIHPIGVVLATSMWWAYESWGGKSLYDSPLWDRTNRASMERPNVTNSGRGLFAFWDLPWVRFFSYANVGADFMTMEDIESQGQAILDRYQEIVFVGHSEYWSETQRDAVEGYIASGGNVLFGTGNTCWWRTEYSPDRKQLLCYKGDNVTDADGGTRGILPGQQYFYGWSNPHPLHPSTYHWRYPPANRGSYSMTGVEWWDATKAAPDIDGHGTPSDWTVRDSSYWVFENTGLHNGSKLGTTRLVNDEIDGVLLHWDGDPYGPDGEPAVLADAYQRGTPATFRILATCEAALPGLTHLQQPRWGVFGSYQQPGQGRAVTIPQRNLGLELWDLQTGAGNPALRQIVLNIVNHLVPDPPPLAVDDASRSAFRAREFPNPIDLAAGEVGGRLSVTMPRASPYVFDVISPDGRRVFRQSGELPAGGSQLTWKPQGGLADGIYFWRLRTASGVARGKVVAIR